MPNAEDEVDFHYICFVRGKDGQFLYELDGDLKGPVCRGPLATQEADSLFEIGLNAVREYIQQENRGDPKFSLMALVDTKDLKHSMSA